MSAENDFVEGLDPTGLASISAAQLLQIVREATPETNKALFIVDETEPDIVSNTRFERYFWFKPTTAALKYYDGANWVVIPIPTGAVDTAQIADDAVTLAKFDPTEGTPLQLLRINAAGTAVEWWTLEITTNSIAVTKLTPGTALYIPRTNAAGTSVEWVSAATIIASLTANDIAITLLDASAATDKDLLYNNAGVPTWGFPTKGIPVSALASTGGTTGQYIRVASGGGFEWVASANKTWIFNSATDTDPVAADIDVAVTKPSGTWSELEIEVIAEVDGDGGAGTAQCDFTYRTAPEVAQSIATGTGSGYGNSGQAFNIQNSDDTIVAKWLFKGYMDSDLVATNTVTVRASFTLTGNGKLIAVRVLVRANYS